MQTLCRLCADSVQTLCRLCGKVDVCEFASSPTASVEITQIRDQLILSLESAEICKELLQMTSLSLNAAITKAVALETPITDSKFYDSRPSLTSSHSSSPSSVAAVDEQQNSPSLNHISGTCQTKTASQVTFCPAAKIRCKSCSRIAHFASVCQQ